MRISPLIDARLSLANVSIDRGIPPGILRVRSGPQSGTERPGPRKGLRATPHAPKYASAERETGFELL